MKRRALPRVSTLAFCLGLSMGLTVVSQAARTPFVSEPTSAIEGIGDYTSMQLDQMGRTHVAYFDQARDALVYAIQTQTGWRTELVGGEGMVGWYASLALDSRGDAHVAYYDATRGVLKYATRTAARGAPRWWTPPSRAWATTARCRSTRATSRRSATTTRPT